MITTVFIAGVFDLLHKGHINILKRARELGDRLIVGINTDGYCAKKGPGRPINTSMVRMFNLKQTGLVDDVRIFYDSPLDLILELRPDVITCGDDYTLETTVGYPQCLEWGGKVVILPRTPNISTTQLIKTLHQIHHQYD